MQADQADAPAWISQTEAAHEALITPVIDGNDLRETLDQIAQQWGGSLTWLDRHNASLACLSWLTAQVALGAAPRR